ncbi:MAG: TMEM165/GDT1 family protein [Promethearchaeia archaeon]
MLIFLMELGDKSQILTITLASIYPNPIEVWIGAMLALSILTLMGAYFGEFIAKIFPKFHLKIISIAIFVIIGIIVILPQF